MRMRELYDRMNEYSTLNEDAETVGRRCGDELGEPKSGSDNYWSVSLYL